MSLKVVSFPKRGERSEEDADSLSGPCSCGACGHEWDGEALLGTVHMKCPKCLRMWGTFKHAIEPDTAWQCNCGERLFWVRPEGVQCRHCGVYQVGWF